MSNLPVELSVRTLAVRILADEIPQNTIVDRTGSSLSPGESGRSDETVSPAAGNLDAVYLFGQTADNEDSVFEAAIRIVKDGLARKILFSASEPKCGYPGFGPWFFALRQRGIPEDRLLGVPPPEAESLNTLTESQAFIGFAKSKNFSRVGVCAAPFHQVRAFMTAVSVAASEFRSCRIYSIPGNTLPWNEVVVHSQGVEQGTRASFIAGEFERIERYQEKGDLLSADQILSYLEARDRHG